MLLTVPPEVLEGIKDTGLMASQELSNLCSMSTPELMDWHEKATFELMGKGLSRGVSLAYLDVMPLLIEKRAISAYVRQHPEAMSALPNLETPTEAAFVGARERNLTAPQTVQLRGLLEQAQAMTRS